MELLSKYQGIKQQIFALADRIPVEKKLLDELRCFEKLLEEKEKFIDPDSFKYRMLFENAADYIFVLSEEGKVLAVNPTACTKYQIPYKEFLNTSILDIDASENKEYISQKVNELLSRGSTRFETIHKTREGKIFNVDIVAKKIIWNNKPAILDVCRDITEQKQLQKALNESEAKLKKIINQISDGIIIYEKNGKVVIWNSGAEDITGIKSADAIGRKLYDLQYEILHGASKDKRLIRKKFIEVVNGINPAIYNSLFENEIYVEGKGVRTLQAIVYPIELEAGNRLFGSVIRDITELKRIENQLRDLNSTKDKIFSIIAHDLRAPFNSIIGFTDLLLNNYDKYDSERIFKILQYINLSAKPTLDVLTNLLNWVNVQTGQLRFQPEHCSLKKLVHEVVNIMNPTANIKTISLTHQLMDDFIVFADVNMLKSVLQNLVANAVKFSHAGGNVSICARKTGSFVEIEVADNGTGIQEERKKELFNIDSIGSTKGTSGEQGSGLGLILCKEFIEKHGGKIWVESQPGEGSRFLFTLPVAGMDESRVVNSTKNQH